ncbi:2-phosphosulfolactate phosphatase [Prauserella cavernicola]|uniref:Probable 2-phosphosulfolactate phosphatase n=1 Tax=Prauserella cavernicola TaxID=2800127 RepID=A0A934QU81_9PSEU|nr:2-phosphosulfolactate phosphatase [Prauserella cavernicola]MBK1786376.1 2-phosphosulfolactate phosphatase [Prauserella cavernicola]
MSVFEQPGHDVRLEWGAEGVAALAPGCAVLVVVDVLSFSTRVDLALARGERIRPVRWLSPEPACGDAMPLSSPNGATLSMAASDTGLEVLAACLRNARAVARRAVALAAGKPVGVVPCGERWGVVLGPEPGSTGPLRPCVEDHLGAGAMVAALLELGAGSPSPEATLAELTWRSAGAEVAALVTGSASGRELVEHGRAEFVAHAVAADASTVAPRLVNGVYDRG